MNPEQRNSVIHITGIVRMIYDLYQERDLIPSAQDYYYAIRNWLEDERTPANITTKVLERNQEIDLIKSDYVLATKWSDGDPQDHWCVGYFSHMLGDRYIVVDNEGKPFRANGFRKAQVIAKERGRWLLKNARDIETTDLGLWDYWIHQPME
jgi:hypothetical protein